MLPITVASVLLLLAGLWWTFGVAAWFAWERHFESPGRREARLKDRAERKNRISQLEDFLMFGLPMVVPIGLAIDGLVSGGRVFYAAGWSFGLPGAASIQILGAALLFVGLPLFTAGAYLTAKYVFSKMPEERTLLQQGPYRYIRHPIYLAFVLLGIGFILLAQNYVALLVGAFLTAFTYPKEEEEELIRAYGDTYREYRRRTGAFLPQLRRGA